MFILRILFLGAFCKVTLAIAIPLLNDEDAIIPIAKYGARIYGLPDPEAGKIVENLDVTQQNPEEVGPYLEGDMLIPEILAKNGIIGNAYRWPGGRIPYVIDDGFNQRSKDLIYKAFDAYHKNTCIRFVRKKPSDYNYISIEKDPSGCWSSVGMTGRGKQIVNLQEPGCTTLPGTSIHELMHAVGFMHEQNRDDRDDYILINYPNIRPGMEGNFDKLSGIDAMGVEYDYGSVMHYGLTSFTRNGRPTMTALRETNAPIGQRRQMSIQDVKKINTMYSCPANGNEDGGQIDPDSNPFGGIFSTIFGFIDGVKQVDEEEHVLDQFEQE